MNFCKKNKNTIIFFFIGIILGLFLMSFKITKQAVPLNDGSIPLLTISDANITSDEYYSTLKESSGINMLLDMIDQKILNNIYQLTDDDDKKIEETIKDTINSYVEYYGIDEKEFYQNAGFKNQDDFKEYITIDYLRKLYLKDYLKENISNNEINYYYINQMPKDFEIMYIKADDTTLDKILNDLNNNLTYEDVIKKYKVKTQNLGYVSFDNEEIDIDIYNEALNLEDNSYTSSIRSINDESYIIFRGKSKDKADVKELSERIKNQIVKEKINADTDDTLLDEALINLHKEKKLTFYDTYLQELYEVYKKSIK